MHSLAITFSSFGSPSSVLRLQRIPLPALSTQQLLLHFTHSPVNHSDINTIQGTYPSQPPFNHSIGAIPGNTASAVVLSSTCTHYKPGDHVIPIDTCLGTWRSHAVVSSHSVYKLKQPLSPLSACLLCINPCTALRLITDYDTDSVVIQNAGTSAVGIAVTQLCRYVGRPVVSVIRDKSVDKRHLLLQNGATLVVTESELRHNDDIHALGRIGLGLNGVGGKGMVGLVSVLSDASVLVTYGGMSRQPVMIPTGSFIFKDVVARGFWLTRWKELNSKEKVEEMYGKVVGLCADGVFGVEDVEEICVEEGLDVGKIVEEVGEGKRRKVVWRWSTL